MGTPDFACPTLEKLISDPDFEIVAIYTREPQIAGRGQKITNSPIHQLALKHNLDVDMGDMLYYVNIGTVKSHGDLKSIKDKETGKITLQMNCKLIEPSIVEKDFEMLKELEMLNKELINTPEDNEIIDRINEINAELSVDDYNVARYLAAFNTRIKPLLVCFDTEVRNQVLINVVKDKKSKLFVLQEKSAFTIEQCKLTNGNPFEPEHQDSYEDLMTMEDKEIKFWMRVNKTPNNMTQTDWDLIVADYTERMRIKKIKDINT